MRIVWLDGELRDPATAALSIDDPAVRWGEGLLETMRAHDGRVPLLARHLERLTASTRLLGLESMPDDEEVRWAVAQALAAAGPGHRRVRLCVTPRPTVLVEVTPEAALPAQAPATSALSIRGGWTPGNRIAEHKTLSYAGHRWSQRRAQHAGAEHALLLDAGGRLGEAAIASVFVASGGALSTAPADGLLSGVAREVVMESLVVLERAVAEQDWRSADEIVLTNSVRGAMAVTSVDGAPVGDGVPGPVAGRIHAALIAAMDGGR